MCKLTIEQVVWIHLGTQKLDFCPKPWFLCRDACIYTVAQKKWEFCQQPKRAQTVPSCKNEKVRMHARVHALLARSVC